MGATVVAEWEQTFALTESFIRLKLMLELLEGDKGSRNLKYFFQ